MNNMTQGPLFHCYENYYIMKWSDTINIITILFILKFEDFVLERSFHLLRKANGNCVNAAAMSDPVRISRAISGIVSVPLNLLHMICNIPQSLNCFNVYLPFTQLNCQDDEGVLYGNWSGNYKDGKKPTHWTGSPKILQQYIKNQGGPVCFGQCWVFSGLVTTGNQSSKMASRPQWTLLINVLTALNLVYH